MKIILLADPNSVHTIRWAKALETLDFDLLVIGISSLIVSDYENTGIKVKCFNQNIKRKEGALSKIKYLFALPWIKKEIARYDPDIVHAHYASSYGLLGALSGFHPFIVSVWGSDVFTFPKISLIHKYVLKYVFRQSDSILSTSHIMAKETKQYTSKYIAVTPFGIDMDKFYPIHVKSLFNEEDIVIGTVKTLEEKYGIEYLIKSFKILSDKYPDVPLKLLIVGAGSLEYNLKNW